MECKLFKVNSKHFYSGDRKAFSKTFNYRKKFFHLFEFHNASDLGFVAEVLLTCWWIYDSTVEQKSCLPPTSLRTLIYLSPLSRLNVCRGFQSLTLDICLFDYSAQLNIKRDLFPSFFIFLFLFNKNVIYHVLREEREDTRLLQPIIAELPRLLLPAENLLELWVI